MSRRPLADVVVLDLSLNLPGPYAARVLGDLGARVIKVEPPRGDPAASMPELYRMLNEGKERVTLDLQTEAGRAALRERIRTADVLIEGFRPGVADKLGFGADSARALNPGLVYCSISAFGQDGPLRELPGHDLNLQALSGACHLGRDGWGRPRGLPLPVADLSAAMDAVAQVLAALYARRADGAGARLDVSLLDTIRDWVRLWGLGVDLAAAPSRAPRWLRSAVGGWLSRRELQALPHYGCFRCRDGRWLAVGIVDEARFWTALCEELSLRPLASVPMAARASLGPLIRAPIAVRIAMAPREVWLARLTRRGIPVTPVQAPGETPGDAWVTARNARIGA